MEQRIIKLNSINFSKNPQQNIIQLTTKNNCLIIYCFKGNSSLRIKNAIYELEENCYFIIPPNSAIIKREIGRSVILDVEYSDYIQPFFMTRFLDEDKNILYLIKKLYKTRYEDLKYKSEIISSCQTLLLLEIMKNSSSFYVKRQSDINDIIEFLRNNYNQSLDFEKVSKSFGYSYSNLRRIFKETTGYSMKKYLTDIKLIEATKLLTDTNLSISTIAEKLNFSGTKYFTQIFQSKYKLTPKEYRLKRTKTNGE